MEIATLRENYRYSKVKSHRFFSAKKGILLLKSLEFFMKNWPLKVA